MKRITDITEILAMLRTWNDQYSKFLGYMKGDDYIIVSFYSYGGGSLENLDTGYSIDWTKLSDLIEILRDITNMAQIMDSDDIPERYRKFMTPEIYW